MITTQIEWLTAISSFAALAAAVATFLTVWEMRVQRLAAYRPDIAFQRATVFFYWYKDVGFGVPVACSSNRFDSGELDLTRAIPRVYLNAVNLGLAAAKTIRAGWDVDIKDCVAVLSAIDTNQQFMIWDDPAGVVTFETSDGARSFKAFRHSVVYDVPYVLPQTSELKPFQVELPFAYVQFLAIYVSLSLQRLDEPDRIEPVLPGIRLRLSYADIGGKLYRRDFSVRASFIYLAAPGSLKQTELCGQAEFEVASA